MYVHWQIKHMFSQENKSQKQAGVVSIWAHSFMCQTEFMIFLHGRQLWTLLICRWKSDL